MTNQRVALITGTSSGFGLLTTLELAKKGFHVIATMRNIDKADHLLQKAKELEIEKNISLFPLDVTNEESFDPIMEAIKTMGKIDLLVNNAGFALGGFAEEIPIVDWRQQFETNFFGLVSLTQRVLPFMRLAKQGRIINISSISGLVGFPGLAPYVSSKYALEGYSEALRLELKPFGIDVILIEPGSYNTNIWSTGNKIADDSLSPNSPYAPLMEKMRERIFGNTESYGDPRDVAKMVVYCATTPYPKLRYPIGKGVKLGIFMKKILPWKTWEKIILKAIK